MTYEEYCNNNIIKSFFIDDDPDKGFIEYVDEPYSDDYIKYLSDNTSNRINKNINRSEYELYIFNNKLKYDRIEKLNELKQISENENE